MVEIVSFTGMLVSLACLKVMMRGRHNFVSHIELNFHPYIQNGKE